MGIAYADGVAEFVDRFNALLPPDFYTRPVPEQRRMYARMAAGFPFDRPAGLEVEDVVLTAGSRRARARTYRPAAATGAGFLYMHGGGLVLGSLETHEHIPQELAARTGAVGLSVDFSPAPERAFPEQLEECFEAYRAVLEGGDRLGVDPRRVAVVGDSSGGNLAVVLCMMARDRGVPGPRAQVLISPVLDFARWSSGGEDVPLLSGDEMAFFTACYAGGADPAHPYISPLRSGELHGLPPAYVLATELDSLCVDSERYADRLRALGIPVELVVAPGLVHACLRARRTSPPVAGAFAHLCEATRSLLAGPDGRDR